MTKFLFEQGDRRRRGAADADDLMHMAGCPQADRQPGDTSANLVCGPHPRY